MFLTEREPRDIQLAVDGLSYRGELFVGRGGMALEVVAVPLDRRPSGTLLKELHKARVGSRAAPVLLVALWGDDRASAFGPLLSEPLNIEDADCEQLERISRLALDEPDRHAAIRALHRILPQIDEPIPGLRNEGLFAMQELATGLPSDKAWRERSVLARPALEERGRDLLRALGFEVEEAQGPWMVLLARGTRRAIAVLLDQPGAIDASDTRFDGLSPVAFALSRADRENLDYVVITAGPVIRVYPTKPGIGTGRRGRTETFIELNLDLLSQHGAGYLWTLCSADALQRGGSFEEVLRRSEEYAANLGSRLRDRVYQDVVPLLARAVVEALPDRPQSRAALDEAYQVTLRILFRLLFVAYAEDKDLLPLHHSRAYHEHSLKRIAQRLAEASRKEIDWSAEPFLWDEVRQLWRAVDRGRKEWSVPDYNGGLFASDPKVSEQGALIERLSIGDDAFGPALTALLVDETAEGGSGPIDFRALGVREFGTIYEGLLESELSVAEVDLAIKDGLYLPAKKGQRVEVRAGEPYLHDASGARKSTGSYYTKSFAVEHLLDRALEPALEEHFARLKGLSEREAGNRFFEFRVADIAMGSGHFLVAAVDRIERRFVNYLAERPLPEVTDELRRLRKAAADKLGADWPGEPLDDSKLLRRQIARRCIFGVDLNPLAVELARLSLWIHTFVPGLPLSLLDFNLVRGNSLVGIATFDEASELLATGTGDLFSVVATERLRGVREPLERLARLADASDAEIREARQLYAEIRNRERGEWDLFTILTAARTNDELGRAIDQGQIATRVERQTNALEKGWLSLAEKELEGLAVLHFPLAFPHVFLGERGGFDVILGNPPWEEATLEEDMFWSRYVAGGFRRALQQRELEATKARLRKQRPDLVAAYEREVAEAHALRRVLNAGAYPGMGTGDPDLYKAFVWRFWHLVAPNGGRIGVVLPRSAMAAKGSGEFRKALLVHAERLDLTTLLNTGEWAFDGVEPRYTIGLTVVTRRENSRGSELLLSGPDASLPSFRAGVGREPTRFYGKDVEVWNDTASLPLLPDDRSVDVFAQLRRAPRLDLDDKCSWRARAHRELDATNDKELFDLEPDECPDGFWPVYKGESFDLWKPDTGSYYGWADPDDVIPVLQQKRERAPKSSAFSEFPPAWRKDTRMLPCLRPRIAFRDVTKWDNRRTLVAALVPPEIVITNSAPYLLWPRGDEHDEAYLLGVLSSIPLDWYARRFVETHVNFFVFNPLPVPRPSRTALPWKRVVQLAGRLAARDRRFRNWAKAVGVGCGPVGDDEQADMLLELDAAVSHLYGLTEAQLVHVFETFHVGWDYQARLDGVLAHFHRLGARS